MMHPCILGTLGGGSRVVDEEVVTSGTLHISTKDGEAMFFHDSLDFTNLDGVDYSGTDAGSTPFRFVLTDAAGKIAEAYGGAAGGGEALGADVLSGWDFTTGWAPTASCVITDANTLTFGPGASASGAYTTTDILAAGRLYKFALAAVPTMGQVSLKDSAGSNTLTLNNATTYKSAAISGAGTLKPFILNASTADGQHLDVTSMSGDPLTDVPITGLHLMSAKNGTTRNMASVDVGFNPNTVVKVSIYGAPDGSLQTGVIYNETADSYSRTGSLTGVAVGSSPGDSLLPIHSQMRRCVLADDGNVAYYLDPADSTKKADGSASVLDGTDGQVMVEIPKFYYKYSWADPLHRWDICNVPKAGYAIHPAFVKAGVEVAYRYIGAYEGYKDGSNVLSSESGRTATGTATRANFRTYAEARGAGWHQLDFYLASAVQLLYLVEYADFDSQAMIGNGNTLYAAWPGVVWATGLSNGDGNATGNASTAGGAATDYMSYRGVENFYGGIWAFVDGVNVHNSAANGSRLYACPDWRDFADDTDTDYDLITSGLAQTDGYARTLVETAFGFLPAGVAGGSSSTGLADYYYTYYNDNPDSGWRVFLLGGSASYGLSAGAFFVFATYTSSYSDANFGGRLCF